MLIHGNDDPLTRCAWPGLPQIDWQTRRFETANLSEALQGDEAASNRLATDIQ